MKKEKLERYADTLARHADAPWVTPFFFVLFFVDSFLMVLPADSLLGGTVSIRPKHIKKWTATACLGSAVGLGVGIFLAQTVLHDYFLQLTRQDGFYHRVQEVIAHAQDYGYVELSIGVFTIVPSVIAGLAGVLVGLNPWVVWLLVVAAKLVKILLTLWLLYTGSTFLRRAIRVYLKTSV